MTAAVDLLWPNPTVVRVGTDAGTALSNPPEGTEIRLTLAVEDTWRTAAAGWPTDQVLANPDSVAFKLWQSRFLVPRTVEPVAATGIAARSRSQVGRSWAVDGALAPGAGGWTIIGCPFAAEKVTGIRPDAGLLEVRRELVGQGAGRAGVFDWEVQRQVSPAKGFVDYGDLCFDPSVDTKSSLDTKLEYAVWSSLAIGRRPLVIGGDHSVSLAAIRECQAGHPNLRVLHLDAHSDRGPLGTPRRVGAGNFITALREELPDLEILTAGVRNTEFRSAPSEQNPADTFVTARQLSTGDGLHQVMEFVSGGPVYLTVDIDVMDPAFAPAVLYPSTGGLSPLLCQQLVSVAASAALVAADFVEVCGPVQGFNAAAANQARLILETILGSTGLRQAEL